MFFTGESVKIYRRSISFVFPLVLFSSHLPSTIVFFPNVLLFCSQVHFLRHFMFLHVFSDKQKEFVYVQGNNGVTLALLGLGSLSIVGAISIFHGIPFYEGSLLVTIFFVLLWRTAETSEWRGKSWKRLMLIRKYRVKWFTGMRFPVELVDLNIIRC